MDPACFFAASFAAFNSLSVLSTVKPSTKIRSISTYLQDKRTSLATSLLSLSFLFSKMRAVSWLKFKATKFCQTASCQVSSFFMTCLACGWPHRSQWLVCWTEQFPALRVPDNHETDLQSAWVFGDSQHMELRGKGMAHLISLRQAKHLSSGTLKSLKQEYLTMSKIRRNQQKPPNWSVVVCFSNRVACFRSVEQF